MKAALTGIQGSGKTTLFNALTGLHRAAETRLHLGAIKVPDDRLERLSSIFHPRRTTPAEVTLADLPGARGSFLDSDALHALRDVDALCLVLGAFRDSEPRKELRDFDAELVFSDLQTVERRLQRLRQERSTQGEVQELERLRAHLEGGAPLRTMPWSAAEEQALAHFGFLSRKPMLVVDNVREADAAMPVPLELVADAGVEGARCLALSAEVEMEISELPLAEQPDYLASLDLREPARARFLRAVYELLQQISFFTVGEDECRAWTIRKGDKAARAAGRIHSDLESSFIRAEVIHYADFLAAGTEQHARETGRLRLEGKDYVVQDGDILHVKAGKARA